MTGETTRARWCIAESVTPSRNWAWRRRSRIEADIWTGKIIAAVRRPQYHWGLFLGDVMSVSRRDFIGAGAAAAAGLALPRLAEGMPPITVRDRSELIP